MAVARGPAGSVRRQAVDREKPTDARTSAVGFSLLAIAMTGCDLDDDDEADSGTGAPSPSDGHRDGLSSGRRWPDHGQPATFLAALRRGAGSGVYNATRQVAVRPAGASIAALMTSRIAPRCRRWRETGLPRGSGHQVPRTCTRPSRPPLSQAAAAYPRSSRVRRRRRSVPARVRRTARPRAQDRAEDGTPTN